MTEKPPVFNLEKIKKLKPRRAKRGAVLMIIAILLLIGGVFYWQKTQKEIKGSPEDYMIIETEKGKFVENKKAGLTVKVPEGWETKRMGIKEGSIVTYTSDIEGRKQNETVVPPLTKGCGIDVSVVYKKMNFDEIKNEIKAIHWGLNIKSEEFEEITINNYQALKDTFDSEVLGSVIAVYIPSKNKLYDFDFYWAPDEKEKCIQEFNDFLETISIQ